MKCPVAGVTRHAVVAVGGNLVNADATLTNRGFRPALWVRPQKNKGDEKKMMIDQILGNVIQYGVFASLFSWLLHNKTLFIKKVKSRGDVY